MKKFLFCIYIVFLNIFVCKAQDNDSLQPSNEIKTNVSNLILFSFADIAYERLLNEDSSFGISLLINIDQNSDSDLDTFRKFSITPYYRRYFSSKYAKGFFVEGFSMYNAGDNRNFFGGDIIADTNYTDFALGISFGGKFVSKSGFMVELYGGLGKNLLNANIAPDFVGRGGVSLGYRF